MTAFVYSCILCMAVLLSYNRFRSYLNVISIFTGIWCIFGALSSCGAYNVRIPGMRVHLYAWIFIIIVDSIWLICARRRGKEQTVAHREGIALHVRAKVVQIIALLLICPFFLKVTRIVLSHGGLATVRQMYFSGTNFTSLYQDLLFRLIPMGMFNALIIYYTFFAFETKYYRGLVYALLNTLFVTLMNGGRYSLILLLYSIVIIMTAGKVDVSNLKLSSRYKKKIRNFTVVLLSILLLVTLSRGQKIIRNIYLYFAGSLSYLDYIVENPSLFALDRPLYGYLTFGAIAEPVVLVLKVLGITKVKVPSYEFNIYCQNYYDIGNGMEVIPFNANTSILYYFLRDFGVIGVIIGACVFGWLTVTAYNNWQKGNRFWGMVFLYLGNSMFNSLMTYQLIGPTPAIIVFTLYLLTQKKFRIHRRYFYGEMA